MPSSSLQLLSSHPAPRSALHPQALFIACGGMFVLYYLWVVFAVQILGTSESAADSGEYSNGDDDEGEMAEQEAAAAANAAAAAAAATVPTGLGLRLLSLDRYASAPPPALEAQQQKRRAELARHRLRKLHLELRRNRIAQVSRAGSLGVRRAESVRGGGASNTVAAVARAAMLASLAGAEAEPAAHGEGSGTEGGGRPTEEQAADPRLFTHAGGK